MPSNIDGYKPFIAQRLLSYLNFAVVSVFYKVCTSTIEPMFPVKSIRLVFVEIFEGNCFYVIKMWPSQKVNSHNWFVYNFIGLQLIVKSCVTLQEKNMILLLCTEMYGRKTEKN